MNATHSVDTRNGSAPENAAQPGAAAAAPDSGTYRRAESRDDTRDTPQPNGTAAPPPGTGMPWAKEWPLTDKGRAKFGVDAPGWLPNYGLGEPDPADIGVDDEHPDDMDSGARSLLVHLGEARSCADRFYGFWMNRDATYPGDPEVAALLARHALACHNVTVLVEMLRDDWKGIERERDAALGAVGNLAVEATKLAAESGSQKVAAADPDPETYTFTRQQMIAHNEDILSSYRDAKAKVVDAIGELTLMLSSEDRTTHDPATIEDIRYTLGEALVDLDCIRMQVREGGAP